MRGRSGVEAARGRRPRARCRAPVLPGAGARSLRGGGRATVTVRLSELKERDVVSVADGRRLGVVGDVEIDAATGRIEALLLPGAPRLLGLFGTEGDLRVPWADIVTIGADVILIRSATADGGGPRS
jgi:YlmC/YmxH family sporulation protein